jgi:hypothetical protein
MAYVLGVVTFAHQTVQCVKFSGDWMQLRFQEITHSLVNDVKTEPVPVVSPLPLSLPSTTPAFVQLRVGTRVKGFVL